MHSGYESSYIREISREMVTQSIGIVQLNGGHSDYWRTIEIVNPKGQYIEHEGLYTSRENAIIAAKTIAKL